MPQKKPKLREPTHIEIDQKDFNGHTIVLLEDRSREMRKPDGTSMQYIIGVEGKDGVIFHKRYITDIVVVDGFVNAKQGAKAIFFDPDKYRHYLGEGWHGYRKSKAI